MNKKLALGIGVVLLGGGIATFLALRGEGGPKVFEPGSVVAALDGQAQWWERPGLYDEQPFRDVHEGRVSQVAIGRDGRFALSFRNSGRVVTLHEGVVDEHVFDNEGSVTALAIEEGVTYVGLQRGAIGIISSEGELRLYSSTDVPFSGNGVVGFAFDTAAGKVGVMVSGGGIYKDRLPLSPPSLEAVPMPQARIRVMGIDRDGEIVVAGDEGQAYVSGGGGWESRPTAVQGSIAAMGRDARGRILIGQRSGHVFREDGFDWEPLGRVGSDPLALGELPSKGIVVVTDDGSVWNLAEGATEFSQADPLATGSATAAIVAGHQVAVVIDGRLHVEDDAGARWSSPETETPRCESVTFDAPWLPILVSCEGLRSVSAEGLAEAEAPEGWPLRMLDDRSGSRARRMRWRGERVWVLDYERGATVLRRLAEGQAPERVVRQEERPSHILDFDVGQTHVWMALEDGRIARAALVARFEGELELEEVVAAGALAERLPEGQPVANVHLVAVGAGVWAIHDLAYEENFAIWIDGEGRVGEPQGIPDGALFTMNGATHLAAAPAVWAFAEGRVEAGGYRDFSIRAGVRARGGHFAAADGRGLEICQQATQQCRRLEIPVETAVPTEEGGAVAIDGAGVVLWIPPAS